MKNKNQLKGHLLAVFTTLIWGTTFVATKSLEKSFSPVEILLIRVILAYILLWIIHPKFSRPTTFKREFLFFLGGLSGVAGYQLLENYSLTTTPATTMSLIISSAPIFTAIMAGICLKDEKVTIGNIIGFIFCIVGIYFINCGGTWKVDLSLSSLIIPIICAILWGVYDIIVRFIHKVEKDDFVSTRRIFFYGLILTVIFAAIDHKEISFDFNRLLNAENILWLLFLGILASGISFYTWNTSEKYLGAIKSSLYLDFQPAVTMIFAGIILNEQITLWSIIGFVCCLLGLLASNFIKGKNKLSA